MAERTNCRVCGNDWGDLNTDYVCTDCNDIGYSALGVGESSCYHCRSKPVFIFHLCLHCLQKAASALIGEYE